MKEYQYLIGKIIVAMAIIVAAIIIAQAKERLEENKRIVAERERENARCRNHDRGMSR